MYREGRVWVDVVRKHCTLAIGLLVEFHVRKAAFRHGVWALRDFNFKGYTIPSIAR